MRILYLHPRAWSGEYSILRKFISLGHSVFALEEARGEQGLARWQTAHYAEPGDGIATLWYDPSRGMEKLFTWPADRLLKRAFEGRNLAHRMLLIHAALRMFSPDAVIASDGFTYAIPAAFLRRIGFLSPPLLASYIGGDILDCPEAEVGKRRTRLTEWLIRKSIATHDILRPVSPLVRTQLLIDGANSSRIRVIPSHLVADRDVLDGVFAARLAFRALIRERHGLAEDAPIVITLGGNQKGKGLHILAKAWPKVLAALPQAHWLLGGPDSSWLSADVLPCLRETGVSGSVIRVGPLKGTSVFEYLAAADLHVNPSLCESLNMVTVEAAAVGTPTVTSDGAGIADWLTRYGAGSVVPRGDVSSLADAIIFSLSSRDKRELWSAAGRTLIAEFSLDRISRDLLDCFRPESEIPQ